MKSWPSPTRLLIAFLVRCWHRRRDPALWKRLGSIVFQVALIYALFQGYSRGHLIDPFDDHVQRGLDAGAAIGRFERWSNTDFEQPLSTWLLGNEGIKLWALVFYGGVQWVVTPIALGWIAIFRKETWPWTRSLFVIMAAASIVIYLLLPVAPPRLTPGFGFVDPWADSQVAARATAIAPEYAAVPSMHCAFASALALVFWHQARHRAVRIAWVVYFVAVLFVVFATSNHWWVDAVAGVALMLASAKGADALARIGPARWGRPWRARPPAHRDLEGVPVPAPG